MKGYYEKDTEFVSPGLTKPGNPLTQEINPKAQWAFDGEGCATKKIDGTACLIDEDGRFFKRYEVKAGKTPPPGFQPGDDLDEETGKQPGWVPVGTGPEDQYHNAAYQTLLIDRGPGKSSIEGTYELIGPKVQGNPHGWETHELVPHTYERLALHTAEIDSGQPLTYELLKSILERHPQIEGIVFHHPDGRRAKIKSRDLGLPWPPEKEK